MGKVSVQWDLFVWLALWVVSLLRAFPPLLRPVTFSCRQLKLARLGAPYIGNLEWWRTVIG